MAESKEAQKPSLKERLKRRKEKRATALKKKIKVSVPVPEGLKKQWDRENNTKRLRARRQAIKKAKLPHKLKSQARRIARYEKSYADYREREHKAKIEAQMQGNFYKPEDPRVMVVIRIRGINRVSPKVRRVLQLFRLRQIHNAVFVRVNKATMEMLKLIQPYIAYGYPSVETIRTMIYKRGFAKIRHKPGAISRIPIMNNDLIESKLGKQGVETVEDMVYQLYTAGKAFRNVNNFLWPFKLNCPRGGYRGRKRRHFNEGGSYGNWEGHINTFINNMV